MMLKETGLAHRIIPVNIREKAQMTVPRMTQSVPNRPHERSDMQG
jgi:hypothetical protein